jgi:hypothetical protein
MSDYVGIDVRRKRAQVAVINQHGKVLDNPNVPGGVEPVLRLSAICPRARRRRPEPRSAGGGWWSCRRARLLGRTWCTRAGQGHRLAAADERQGPALLPRRSCCARTCCPRRERTTMGSLSAGLDRALPAACPEASDRRRVAGGWVPAHVGPGLRGPRGSALADGLRTAGPFAGLDGTPASGQWACAWVPQLR